MTNTATEAYKPQASDNIYHWAYPYYKTINSTVITEKMDSSILEKSITRGEFITLLTNALGIYRTQESITPFRDVTVNSKYVHSISSAYKTQLIQGYPTCDFHPDKLITREECMVIISQLLPHDNESDINHQVFLFSDTNSISKWANPKATLSIKNGMFVGDNFSKLRPKDELIWAEAFCLIEKLIKEMKLK